MLPSEATPGGLVLSVRVHCLFTSSFADLLSLESGFLTTEIWTDENLNRILASLIHYRSPCSTWFFSQQPNIKHELFVSILIRKNNIDTNHCPHPTSLSLSLSRKSMVEKALCYMKNAQSICSNSLLAPSFFHIQPCQCMWFGLRNFINTLCLVYYFS